MKKLLHNLLLAAVALGFLAATAQAKILFVTHNTPALKAVGDLVEEEYNLPSYSTWLEADLAASRNGSFNRFRNSTSYVKRDAIPNFDALVTARLAELGLQPDDPADKGFTDYLSSLGYHVVRSTSLGDPVEQQFTGELTPEKIALLKTYDLIIFSRDTEDMRQYSRSGSAAEGALVRITAWNSLDVPLLNFNPQLATGSEVDFFWGWTYGFTLGNPNTVSKFNGRDYGALAPVPYDQEVWEPNDPFLAGITVPNDFVIDLYKDEPFLPSSLRKFSNNQNFEFGSSSTMIVEYVVPDFSAGTAGNIETRDSVLIRFSPGQTLWLYDGTNPPSGIFPDLTAQDVAQSVGADRIFFAAGMHNHGIFNLNTNGETVLANIVGTYATPDPAPVSIWSNLPAVAGWREAPFGWVNDVQYPYVYSLEHDQWLWIDPASASAASFVAYRFSSQDWIWSGAPVGNWFYNLSNPSSGMMGWSHP